MQSADIEKLLEIINCLFEIDSSASGLISPAMKRKLEIKMIGSFASKKKSYVKIDNVVTASETNSDGGKLSLVIS